MAKRFIKVHTKLLMEAFCHKSGFVTIDGAITIAFLVYKPTFIPQHYDRDEKE